MYFYKKNESIPMFESTSSLRQLLIPLLILLGLLLLFFFNNQKNKKRKKGRKNQNFRSRFYEKKKALRKEKEDTEVE